MDFSFSTHWQWLDVLPSLAVGWGKCDEDCEAKHLVFTLSWLVWMCEIVVTW